ncbi:hypothetical protein [Paenibacillus sp. A3]|uniref:hypothetical protein n=1 Tax=Paenibacillus sp. A3 TaxID=1337054 RepID=UPI000A79231F|nr:hypothetical protein [Paenibacillus sp. A3]
MGTADWIRKKQLSTFFTKTILFAGVVAFGYWVIFHGLPLALEHSLSGLTNWK